MAVSIQWTGLLNWITALLVWTVAQCGSLPRNHCCIDHQIHIAGVDTSSGFIQKLCAMCLFRPAREMAGKCIDVAKFAVVLPSLLA